MTTSRRWLLIGAVGVGLLSVAAGTWAGMRLLPPPSIAAAPPPPELPASPPGPDAGTKPPALPQPPAPPAPGPAAQPPAPAAEPEITEPVVTVYRFSGKYLGGDATRALVYVPTGADKAEVQNRPLANAIPAADGGANEDVKRIEVPAGEAVAHGGSVFLTTRRELLVIDADCRPDWRFALSGRPDNGERLLGVAGFDGGKVFVAVQHDPKPGAPEKATGRVFTFDTGTGRHIGFTTIAGGFEADARLTADAPFGTLVAFGASGVLTYGLAAEAAGYTAPIPTFPVRHATTSGGMVFATTPRGIGATRPNGFDVLIADATGTAPVAVRIDRAREFARVYAPLKWQAGHFSLTAVDRWGQKGPVWSVRVPREITTAPVLHAESVYFVAGAVAYRVNAATGAVCWKQTLPLNAGEALTELAFTAGEVRASGPGVLVRVAERADPPPVAKE